MPTNLENLATRRTAIYTELASFVTKPSYSKAGQSVDWTSYRKSLYEELEYIDGILGPVDGSAGAPFELPSQGTT